MDQKTSYFQGGEKQAAVVITPSNGAAVTVISSGSNGLRVWQ